MTGGGERGEDLGGKDELHHVAHVERLSELILEFVLLSELRHPVGHGICIYPHPHAQEHTIIRR